MIAERTETSYESPVTSSRNDSPYANSRQTHARPETHTELPTHLRQRPESNPGHRRVERRERSSRPMGHRGPAIVRHVRTLGWRSPMTLAVLVASFLVTIAAVYISAYARVAAEGMQEAQLQRDIDKAALRHSELTAEVSALSLASDVGKTATQLSMVPNDAKSEQLLSQPGATVIPDGTAGTSVGNSVDSSVTEVRPIIATTP